MNSSIRTSLLFVVLWSSAYIAFELCSAHVEPATFVVVRTGLTALLLLFLVKIFNSSWPKRWASIGCSVIVGVLIHAVYAGGSFASIHHGMDISLCALILSLQPLVTVVLSSTFLSEKITARKMLGVLAGLFGVSILILDGEIDTTQFLIGTATGTGGGSADLALVMCFVALLAISIGTIVQKRYCSDTPVMSGACIQFSSAAVFMLPFALTIETMHIDWNISFVVGLTWLIVVVSIGAMSLLMVLIKHGEAGAVSNLFYLVTPLTAIEAWILFDEKLSAVAIGGMILCMLGVIVVNSVPNPNPRQIAAKY